MFDLVEVESGSRAVADLPLELERDILELTARAFPESATRLALVAHRAQIWQVTRVPPFRMAGILKSTYFQD